MASGIQRAFAPFKRLLPKAVWAPIRSLATAVITPINYAISTGHFRSSFANKAVSPSGQPVPWYSYPMIDLISRRDFTGRTVLEFGGGQSTLWWAGKAAHVTTIEQDDAWANQIRATLPANVDLRYVPLDGADDFPGILEALGATYDVIIIDGHRRRKAMRAAVRRLKPGGALIVDNSDIAGFLADTHAWPCQRVDFWGNAPGVVTPQATSLIFFETCFLLSPDLPIDGPKP